MSDLEVGGLPTRRGIGDLFQLCPVGQGGTARRGNGRIDGVGGSRNCGQNQHHRHGEGKNKAHGHEDDRPSDPSGQPLPAGPVPTTVSAVPIDLHTHSTSSDGSLTPTQLVELAATVRLDALALTDHDTLEGISEARAAAERLGIELIPGVELSLAWDRGGMHMLVLWLEPGSGPLQDRLAELQDARNGRNARIVDRLNELGLELTLEEIENEAGEGSVGRPHFAAVMVRKGYVPDIKSAFDEYLANGRPAYMPRYRLQPEDAIDLARRSGGVPILAHAHTLGLDNQREVEGLLERLVGAGLVGIECHYGSYDSQERAGYVAMASRFGLLPSGGSDFHGTYKADVALGTGSAGIAVPNEILEPLRSMRS